MTEIFTWPLPTTELSDGRLVLRTMRAEDAEDVYLCSIDERMKRYTTVPVDYSREMARNFISGQHGHSVFALQWTEFGERYCGNIEARLIDESVPAVALGYNTAPWARGRGLQTRAVTLMLEHCFAHGVHRVEVMCRTDNVASRHVAEAAGCHLEGVLRDAEQLRGERHDLALYAKLSTD